MLPNHTTSGTSAAHQSKCATKRDTRCIETTFEPSVRSIACRRYVHTRFNAHRYLTSFMTGRLAAGPRNFVIIGEPQAAKHVLRGYGNVYAKGLVAEVSEFLFGSGFAIAEGELWTVSFIRAAPLHRRW